MYNNKTLKLNFETPIIPGIFNNTKNSKIMEQVEFDKEKITNQYFALKDDAIFFQKERETKEFNNPLTNAIIKNCLKKKMIKINSLEIDNNSLNNGIKTKTKHLWDLDLAKIKSLSFKNPKLNKIKSNKFISAGEDLKVLSTLSNSSKSKSIQFKNNETIDCKTELKALDRFHKEFSKNKKYGRKEIFNKLVTSYVSENKNENSQFVDLMAMDKFKNIYGNIINDEKIDDENFRSTKFHNLTNYKSCKFFTNKSKFKNMKFINFEDNFLKCVNYNPFVKNKF